jgi:hypothetical protein
MVSGLAFVVFIINTGIFNGVAEQVWGPVRRHLEALLPLAPAPPREPTGIEHVRNAEELRRLEVEHQQQHGALVAPTHEPPQRQRRPGELDPAEVAARLLEQRRQANAGWLITQIRRIEHSFLLFLASLVPGVGERHVRARELEDAAIEEERQRQIAAAEAATAAENPERTAGVETAAGGTENVDENGEQIQPENQDGDALRPLVEA